ncbi:MAG: polyphosphate kinase 2 family protein, partial [bacterium]|nr:polyphosphate kinase 2 family protein [bacterium]
HEQHLARNGTIILKFWLNVSKEEQRQRFLSRLNEPEKNWKFSEGDVKERASWPQYMQAYEEALNATSRAHAPWYAIPADSKPFMRYTVASIIRQAFEQMAPDFPTVSDKRREELKAMRGQLEKA